MAYGPYFHDVFEAENAPQKRELRRDRFAVLFDHIFHGVFTVQAESSVTCIPLSPTGNRGKAAGTSTLSEFVI
jgi:hypothetical protein